jgi:hypothetical protein
VGTNDERREDVRPAPETDTSWAHTARVYDYLIGGHSNFAVDRETAAKVLLQSPNARIAPSENRAFPRPGSQVPDR